MLKINSKNGFALAAFTLAEVLIVIGIVGMIANLTIPTLMQNVQKQVQVTQLKKFYTVFQAGIKKYMLDQGCYDLQCTGLFEGNRTNGYWATNMNTVMRSIFKVDKSCNPSAGGCDKYMRALDKTPYPTNQFYFGYIFKTSDNYLVQMWDSDAGNCSNVTTTTSKLNHYCGQVYVDINGSKPPDIIGRDMFIFVIGNDGSLYASGDADGVKFGSNTEDYQSAPSYWRNNTECGTAGSSVIPAGSSGLYCAARIIENSWEMDY